ncbi:hypothetical protein [Chlorobium sp. N1]|uniref:hypothetical protein n=1 Tax=Chlorobium sp. N1 TaxID=2491138 RepID=UPI00103DC98B|nr:hypothetical protein [Chlorobium sp. N1]TCD47510.1 hypothetical protein E0L29_08210 [Chlorobium sp. N1]
MMSIFTTPPHFDPERIGKPTQLTAAQITGIVLINIVLLSVAVSIGDAPMVRMLVILGDLLITIIGLVGLFILQSRYRPEMQDDEHYSRYLERKMTMEYEARRRELEAEERRELILTENDPPDALSRQEV